MDPTSPSQDRIRELEHKVSRLEAVEAALAAGEERFRALSEATFEAIFISDQGICIEANSSASRMFGYTHDELIGIFGSDVIAPEAKDLVKRNMLAGLEEPYEAVAVRKDGSTFPCEIQGRMFDYQGKRVRVTALRDISKRVAAQESLQQARKLEAIGLLAGGVAHDFNNLVTVIQGNAALVLERTDLAEDARRRLQNIHQTSRRAVSLIAQLLAIGRREPMDRRPTDLNRLILDLGEILDRLIDEDIEIEKDLGAGVPAILADPTQFERLLINLVANARDAIRAQGPVTDRKLIRIRTRRATPEEVAAALLVDSPAHPFVVLTITDTGVGMTPQELAQAYDPFYTTKDRSRGAGLGLASSYGIVQQNGGTIRAVSTPGQGTTFAI